MADEHTTSKEAVERFWDEFVDLARKSGVKGSAMPWYVRHAERYLKAHSGKQLAEHGVDDVTGYLEAAGRIGRIEDWQFVQIVDAIRTLLLTASAPVVGDIDWALWRDSAKSLAADHPTIAREDSSGTQPDHDARPVSGARFKEKRNAPSTLDAERQDHGALLERLAAEIRRRKYSIRTEQAYESWVCRFILFCGNRDPAFP